MRRLLGQLARLLPKRKKSLRAAESGVQWERSYAADELKRRPVSERLAENLAFLNEVLGHNSDFVLREIRLGVGAGVPAALAYVDGLVDRTIVSDTLIKGLTLEGKMAGVKAGDAAELLRLARSFLVTVAAVKEAADYFALLSGLLYGEVALFIDGADRALLVDAKGWAVRNIEEPASEGLVRGPREGFTELMRTNTALIRRRLRDPNLVVEGLCFGERTRTQVEIVYIRNLAAPELVQEIKERLSRIRIDGILDSGQIEELIEDNPYTPFPQVFHTERPDRVVSMLLEGRVAIITDGTPIVLVVPAEFAVFMQAGEDYYERYFLATAIRWLRYIALVISLTLPSLYIAMTTYHQEMIPPRLLTSVASSREGIPFPAFVEALLMEFAFEALREAGIRLPRQVGQAVSIVGALVIGQAAVSANIVSPLMVIVVALTGIASFAAPVFSLAITMRLLRFPMMICAATLGLYGIVAGILAVLVHAAGLRSFGVPYLAPLAPLHRRDLKDMLVRAPTWAMDHRPTELVKGDERRQAPGQRPRPGSRRLPGGGGGGA